MQGLMILLLHCVNVNSGEKTVESKNDLWMIMEKNSLISIALML